MSKFYDLVESVSVTLEIGLEEFEEANEESFREAFSKLADATHSGIVNMAQTGLTGNYGNLTLVFDRLEDLKDLPKLSRALRKELQERYQDAEKRREKREWHQDRIRELEARYVDHQNNERVIQEWELKSLLEDMERHEARVSYLTESD